uniref:Ferritin n=1 Tax=Ditylenchus dipsaci TaxID=166011 RepID=A0A915EKS5_9BILA
MEFGKPIAASRQNYSVEVEEAVNKQINRELSAFYQYAAMSSYFGRAEVALPGAALFFGKQSMDEKSHAQKLIDYQCIRGGKVVYTDIKAPTKQQWSTLLMAVHDALEMERITTKPYWSFMNWHRIKKILSLLTSSRDSTCRNKLWKSTS